MITNPQQRQMRQVFFDAFHKSQNKKQLSQVEKMLADIIQEHPEYHFIFKNPEKYLEQSFFPELGDVNPFMHMSLHMALLEQLSTNRPVGIRDIFQKLMHKHNQDSHLVAHLIMEQIADAMLKAQKSGQMPDDAVYLHRLNTTLISSS